jgi:predicted amidophosphoribosyltransferase
MTVPSFYCENCGRKVTSGNDSCPGCGQKFYSVRCPSCGFVGASELFKQGCPDCAYSGEEDTFQDKTKNTDYNREPGEKIIFKKKQGKQISSRVYKLIIGALAIMLFFLIKSYFLL